ncbi:hypothetical protein [Heyndrickxia camelliae]|uniref:Uncharacterized protein n=1 Tax=Heyndrickxia camelliae TaxID=1707093 RepID=A0A2N3LG28_9BACI|nr:hypothetical protein [Heyndrickxia camelliae]PKR83559.1 hypothetical protein CWO92_18515 [Heyndrickxia camelliae]
MIKNSSVIDIQLIRNIKILKQALEDIKQISEYPKDRDFEFRLMTTNDIAKDALWKISEQ